MDNTLIDRETLGQFIDELIKKKNLPMSNGEDFNTLREESIQKLDRMIGIAIFSQLDSGQTTEYHQMLNQEVEPSEEEYQNFFNNAGIDLEKTISDCMQKFATEFLGGENV